MGVDDDLTGPSSLRSSSGALTFALGEDRPSSGVGAARDDAAGGGGIDKERDNEDTGGAAGGRVGEGVGEEENVGNEAPPSAASPAALPTPKDTAAAADDEKVEDDDAADDEAEEGDDDADDDDDTEDGVDDDADDGDEDAGEADDNAEDKGNGNEVDGACIWDEKRVREEEDVSLRAYRRPLPQQNNKRPETPAWSAYGRRGSGWGEAKRSPKKRRSRGSLSKGPRGRQGSRMRRLQLAPRRGRGKRGRFRLWVRFGQNPTP